MSKKELSRLEIMQRIEGKGLTQKEAAQMLGLSLRHVKRLYRAYRQGGAQGLVSKRRGKPSNNRLDPQVEQRAIDLIHERYMNLLQPPIDEYKIACGKVVRRTLTTFPQALRLRWMFPKKGTSLLWRK